MSLDDSLNVPAVAKLEAMQELLKRAIELLSAHATDEPITGDDLVDLFAIGIAAVIDNDDRVAALSDIRKGAEVAAKRIVARARELRVLHEAAGSSFLALVMQGVPLDFAPKLDS